jgi:hypothetical protein
MDRHRTDETVSRLGFLAVALLLPLATSGHHSFPEHFNTSQIAEIEGEVTEVRWSNPHVSFTMRTVTGEIWKVESNSIRGLEEREISRDVIRVGNRFRLAGFPARDGSHELYTSNILLADGREVVLRPGSELRWQIAED